MVWTFIRIQHWVSNSIVLIGCGFETIQAPKDKMGMAYVKLAGMSAAEGERLWILRPKLHAAHLRRTCTASFTRALFRGHTTPNRACESDETQAMQEICHFAKMDGGSPVMHAYIFAGFLRSVELACGIWCLLRCEPEILSHIS